jgi:hypothetical protein
VSSDLDELTAEVQAALLVRVHCAVDWPKGPRCNNCGYPHPCDSYQYAVAVLVDVGWRPGEIAAVDRRSGPWS